MTYFLIFLIFLGLFAGLVEIVEWLDDLVDRNSYRSGNGGFR